MTGRTTRILFDQAWRLLKFHSERKGETQEQTLNRLFCEQLKCFWPSSTLRAPHIWEHNLAPCRDTWGIDRLRSLRLKHDRTKPDKLGDPIVIVNYQDLFCLVDGTKRVNLALREGKELGAILLKVRPAD